MKKYLKTAILSVLLLIALASLSPTASAASSADNAPDNPSSTPISAPTNPSLSSPKVTPPQQRTPVTTNAADPNLVLLMFGQEVAVREGAIYYESADLAGSGRHGTANNCYTAALRIAGFAQVDAETGRLIDYHCYMREDVPIGEQAPSFVQQCTEETLFVATYTEGFTTGSVGWFRVDDLTYNPGELELNPQKPDYVDLFNPDQDFSSGVTTNDVADAIEASSENGANIALFLDASGSVNAYSANIASYAKQVDNANYVAIFASSTMTIQADEYSQYYNSVGSGTDIYAALNTLPAETFDIVIIVTDTEHNGYTRTINERNDIGSVVILNIYDPKYVDRYVIDDITNSWHVAPIIRQLNME